VTETVDRLSPPTPPIRPGATGPFGVEKVGPTRAVVPPAKRLSTERTYTTPGVHPYDAVPWERRDVVMTNWRDGSINFEQRGVEFPSTWSVNASNIVTTKYFRGAVGTPQREWSLRQLIDRVVGRYVAAGKEGEYFASDDDADVFGLELTHMLLHQVFSFNSPVWFNVGTTAPQQVSACQPYEALVSTPEGLVKIGELVERGAVGTKVYDAHGLAQVLAVKDNGVKEVLRVTTKSGHALDVTADHLVWRSTGDGTGAFVPAGALRVGNTLEWHRRDEAEDAASQLDVAEAALAGWLQGDGFVGQYDGTNRSLTIEALTVTDAELAWVTRAVDAVFPEVHRHERSFATQRQDLDGRRTRLYGTGLEDFVTRWGLRTRGIDMQLPPQLYTAPLPVVRPYLRSLFQAEGFVSARERSTMVGLAMISEDVVRGVQALLTRFGIFSRVGHKIDKRPDRHDTFEVRIQSEGDRLLFEREIGFVDPVKAAKLHAGFAKPGLAAAPVKRLQIASIETRGLMNVYDIQTDSGEYLSAAGLRVHNCFILAVDDTMDSILNWYREEGLIFKGGSGAGLNLSRIRSARELLSSGGTASGPVSFMRGADASAGTIKSGGATRRAAKMVVLDVDHPDIVEFVETKQREENKIRALRDAGYDMDLGGRDITSVQYQNANNSVRVNGEFMRAVEDGKPFGLRGRMDGEVLETVDARALMRTIATAAWECADPGIQYDDTINDWHTTPETGRINASNPCSEYMSLDNSSCNLASLNLMTFLRPDGTFDAKLFATSVALIITAMEISISFADFPTEAIGATTRAYRQLGIGYANLGALLMATGHAYDSEGGRALAAAITSLMTGTAYKRSAEIAGVVGPYAGYARNASAHTRVMRKHAAANDAVRAVGADDARVMHEAGKAWAACLTVGDKNGWRNAQASVLAPTGCLTADTLVTTDRGLARLGELGNTLGSRWQDLDLRISTDEGPQQTTKFFVNGEEPTRRIATEGGYRIQGTLAHRLKVVDGTGAWVWRRMADIAVGDLVPLQLGTLVGEPRRVPLPVLDEAYWTADARTTVPDVVDAELAELVGYFMGDGSLHAAGLRFCVADTDLDVVGRLQVLAKQLFTLDATVTAKAGYHEVALTSVRLARWWTAAGLAKTLPAHDHVGKGWTPRVPSCVLETNDPVIYAAFVRGLLEADGTVSLGVPVLSTASGTFASEVQTLLLVLGFPTTLRETVSGFGGPVLQLRLRNRSWVRRYAEEVGFLSARKAAALVPEVAQRGSRDRVHLAAAAWEALVPVGHQHRDRVVADLRKTGGVARDLAAEIHGASPHPALAHALGYVFERVADNADGGVQPTFDLSVPSNVTYVANGMVSHNTIGFMMDCDTTGIEPDFSLVKSKKLVGGASMKIVNATVEQALTALGYQGETVEAIVAFVAEHGHVVNAPGLKPEHYDVFDCAVGERSITGMGHIRMMAAVQPFISGAISKTVNLPQSATVEDIEDVYIQGWKLGVKALAVYRDMCKVGQPMSAGGTATKDEGQAAEVVVVEKAPSRQRLPKKRRSSTYSFSVAGAEGYLTAGEYEDGRLGEVFIKMSKQGSTLAGVMDAFSVSISIGLQYGVPLDAFVSKFTNMRFDPAGMTDDADIRIASSVMDYLFRRLALDYLPFDQRSDLGIFTAEERARSVATGSYGPLEEGLDVSDFAVGVPVEAAPVTAPVPPAAEAEAAFHAVEAEVESELAAAQPGESYSLATATDAPLCFTCGVKMRPAGSCYVCESCGSTSGCS